MKPVRHVTKVRISDIDVSEKRSEETESEMVPQVPQVKPQVPQVPQVKPQVPQVKPKPQVKSKPQVKPQVKSKPIRKTHKSNTRSNHRSKKQQRKISIKAGVFNEKDVKEVETKMKEIRCTKTDEIKKKLESQGVKVSGKSNRLLRDIYMYSQVCNINIQHEK